MRERPRLGMRASTVNICFLLDKNIFHDTLNDTGFIIKLQSMRYVDRL